MGVEPRKLEQESWADYYLRLLGYQDSARRNKQKVPKYSPMTQARINDLRRERIQEYRDKIERLKQLPGAGTREPDKADKVPTLKNGKPANRNPGSRGGRNSRYRYHDKRQRELNKAKFAGICMRCREKIHGKQTVVCYDPQEIYITPVAVICKSCCMCEADEMKFVAGAEVWAAMREFKNGNVRAWLRWKLMTIDDEKLDKFKAYVLGLDRNVSPGPQPRHKA